VIKVAHFVIVQQAERLTQPTAGECDEFSAGRSPCEFEDSGYESQGTQADRGEDREKISKSSFEWVRKMMDGFMVRGCGSPMQWMLDLRGYGMKIDFNTTSAGHVNWRDGDTLEYKAVKFNMAEFRGMVGGLHQAYTGMARRNVIRSCARPAFRFMRQKLEIVVPLERLTFRRGVRDV
jgi:hypothetical protein